MGCWHRRKNEGCAFKYRPCQQLSTSTRSKFILRSARHAELSKHYLQKSFDASQSGHFNEQIFETVENKLQIQAFRLRHPTKFHCPKIEHETSLPTTPCLAVPFFSNFSIGEVAEVRNETYEKCALGL